MVVLFGGDAVRWLCRSVVVSFVSGTVWSGGGAVRFGDCAV